MIKRLTIWLAIASMATASALASSHDIILHGFPSYSNDGLYPWAALVGDGKGNYFGTTSFGGDFVNNGTSGTVFEISPDGKGGTTEKIIYSFSGGADGGYPTSTLIFDNSGNLYGTTSGGGPNICGVGAGCGVVFELSPNTDGTWSESVLYSFTGAADGFEPIGGLVFDGHGNLFGTTTLGALSSGSCFFGCGAIYELSPDGKGRWNFSTLYDFHDGRDGAGPAGQLVIDQQGNLYGTDGGAGGFQAAVYELSPVQGGGWKFTSLAYFPGGADGQEFVPGLTRDSHGNLFGAIPLTGANGYGFLFKMERSGSTWKHHIIYNFTNGSDGGYPYATPLIAADGLMYGTTYGGGLTGNCGNDNNDCGVVYKLSLNGDKWIESTVYQFHGGNDGATPYGSLIYGPNGSLLGNTYYGYKRTSGNPG